MPSESPSGDPCAGGWWFKTDRLAPLRADRPARPSERQDRGALLESSRCNETPFFKNNTAGVGPNEVFFSPKKVSF